MSLTNIELTENAGRDATERKQQQDPAWRQHRTWSMRNSMSSTDVIHWLLMEQCGTPSDGLQRALADRSTATAERCI
jgi:hypothetical protein